MLGSRGIRTYKEAVAVITGGASGIGAALARELVRQGAAVVIADRQIDLATEVVSALVAKGGKAGAVEVDVRNAGALESVVGNVFSSFGRLDYIFNNAGTVIAGEVLDYQPDEWRYIIEVNLMGVVHGVAAAYPRMVSQGFGHIVNTASMAALMPSPLVVSYSVTKHAVLGLSRSLRVEGAAYGVRVSVLCPGVIRTPIMNDGGRFGRITRPLPPQVQADLIERFRPMDPDRFASKALQKIAANKEIIILPGWWKAIWLLNRLSPLLGSRLAARHLRIYKNISKSMRL